MAMQALSFEPKVTARFMLLYKDLEAVTRMDIEPGCLVLTWPSVLLVSRA